jgi:signal transduction histidine kinase
MSVAEEARNEFEREIRRLRARICELECELSKIKATLRYAPASDNESVVRNTIDARCEQVIASLSEGLVVADPEGNILSMNPAGVRFHRWENKSEALRNLRDFPEFRVNYPDGRPVPVEQWPLGRLMRGETFLDFEVQLTRVDTGEIWFGSYSGTPIRNEAGEVSMIVMTFRDITERKQAEDALERANRMKREFLARMSHELRTPMNAIIGFSDLLMEQTAGPLNEKQNRFVGHVQTGARHVMQLINDILDLSKIEAGRAELHLEEFRAADALVEVLSVILPLSDNKRIQLDNKVGYDVTVKADRIRFKQILYNLLSNAVKFTPENGNVCVESGSEGGAVLFIVSDTGVGIPQEEHKEVFKEFQQISVTANGTKEGSGLGLAISKMLVEQHGGRIWLESEHGKGARFFFTLPAAPCVADPSFCDQMSA